MARTALDRAERLFAAGRYAELVSLLEPQVPVYRESQRFYFLLGLSCLRAGDHGGAMTYLKRAEQLSPSHADTMLALAALCVRKGETEKAIDYYLRILEGKPGHRRARSCLAVLRKEGGPDGLARLIESGRIERLYPGTPRMPRYLLPAALAILALAAAYWLVPYVLPLAERAFKPRGGRPEVSAVVLTRAERDSAVVTSGSFRYVLTEAQALSAFERAKDFFQAYRDNAAMIEINRLLGSNASSALKEKAKSLKAFVGKPDFRTVRDDPGYAQAQRDPPLYEGCSVVWKGMAANVRAEAGSVLFDFLVGYQEKKRLEGLIPSRVAGSEVPVDRPLEILGTLRVANGSMSLDCVAIHELVASP